MTDFGSSVVSTQPGSNRGLTHRATTDKVAIAVSATVGALLLIAAAVAAVGVVVWIMKKRSPRDQGFSRLPVITNTPVAV